jgi:cytosine/adenosine deaminase-related metal-dependent hydrolase
MGADQQVSRSTASVFIKDVLVWRRGLSDLLLSDGKISAFDPDPKTIPDNAVIVDGKGQVLLPGLVEAHTHMDKTLLGMGWHPNSAGPLLIDKIDNERRIRREIGIDPRKQSEKQLRLSITKGSTHFRTHVDVDTECGLAGIEGLLATREAYRHMMDMEIVAFPQSGLMIRPGTYELLDAALHMGADVVGGLDPCAIDRAPKEHLDLIFGLSERHGKPVDIHLHEPAELGAFSMELIIERTRALGMQGHVTISHAFCLGMTDRSYARHLMSHLAQEKIAIMTHGAPSRPVPPIAECYEFGITVCSGSDGIRDSWGPYGNGDMLERAMILGLRNNFRRDDEVEMGLDACTYGGAKVMKSANYGLNVGCDADLVMMPAEAIAHAVAERPANRTVFKKGSIVAKSGVIFERPS